MRGGRVTVKGCPAGSVFVYVDTSETKTSTLVLGKRAVIVRALAGVSG